MKSKVKFLSWMFVASLFLAFNTACSDDEEDKTDYAEKIEGAYTGTVYNSIPLMVAVDYVSFNQAKFSVASFFVPAPTGEGEEMEIPAVEVTCDVTGKSGEAAFTGQTTVTIAGMGEDLGVNVIGTVDNEGVMSMNILVETIPLPIPFSGVKGVAE